MKKILLFLVFLIFMLTNEWKINAQGTCPVPPGILVTAKFTNGSRTINSNEAAIVYFDYDVRGQSNTNNFPQVATYGEVGAVWGLAYNYVNKKLYASAMIKRHCDLGPGGTGAIYEIDLTTPTESGAGTPTLWLDVNNPAMFKDQSGNPVNLGLPTDPGAAVRELGHKSSPNHDSWAYPRVGRQGLGDIEFSEDLSKLYVMDLTNRQVLVIDYATKRLINAVPVPDPGCATADDRRPWALKSHNGEVYVGVVCTGETNQEQYEGLSNHIMKFDNPNSPSTLVNVLTYDSEAAGWWLRIWTDDWDSFRHGKWDGWPQLIISDIEFDENDNMAIGMMDIYAHETGYANYSPKPDDTELYYVDTYGRVLRAAKNGSGWDTPDPEFYDTWDFWEHTKKKFMGGMVITDCSGTDYLTANLVDPFRTRSGGPITVKTADGKRQGSNYPNDAALEIYYNDLDNPAYFGKAGGLGDLEYLWSTNCELTDAGKTNESCSDNGTGTDGSDDYITFNLNPTGTGTASTYNVSVDGNATIYPDHGTYGSTTSFHLQPGSANGTQYTITITDTGDNGCTITTTVQQDQCSNACNLTDAGKTNETCNNGGTPSDPSDDYITFDLNPQGVNHGSTYTVSVNNGGSITPQTGTYGSVTSFQLQAGSANGATYTVTITDDDNPDCEIETTVSQNSCSDECLLQDAGLTSITCSNTGADDDDTNDYIMFDLNPTGLNLGGTYTVTVSSGTVTLSDGTLATNVPYGSIKHFRLQNGSAGAGDVTITIVDDSDNGCSLDVLLEDPGSCSNTCPDPYPLCPGESYEASVQTNDIDASTIQWYKSTDGGNTFYPIAPPEGTSQTLTITEVGEYYYTANGNDGCMDSLCCHIVVEPGNCPGCQLLTAGLSNLACNDNGTLLNPDDDYITFTLNPQGNQLGSGYKVTADSNGIVSPSVASYGSPTNFQMQPGSANGTLYTITITDNDDPNCKITTTVQLNDCGESCEITSATVQNEECHNNNTNGDTGDDYITFDLIVNGTNTAGTFSVSTSSGTIIPTTGSYGATNHYTLSNGTAGGGNITITITDANDPNCTLEATVLDPGTCSVCDLTVDAGSNENICRGTCVDLSAIASGGSGSYSYVWDNGASGSTINVCPDVTTTYKVTVTDTKACEAEDEVTVYVDACPFDLALKLTTTQTDPVRPGNIVPFIITVCNQSFVTVKSIEVTDYIPAGFTLADSTWTAGNIGHTGYSASKVFSVDNGGLLGNGLEGGQCMDFTINLKVNSHAGPDDFTNYAEITNAVDEYGNSDDEDSTPGSDAPHELAVGCGDPDDNNMDGAGLNDIQDEDEDDHDPACVDVFDLALKKVEKSTGPYKYGDQVTFTYTIYNQGNLVAQNIDVTDYVPSGFKYYPLLNPGWSQSQTNTPVTRITDPLNPGDEMTVTLVLILQATDDKINGWTNRAEISHAEDDTGRNLSDKDYDSVADNNPDNDAGGVPDGASDNVVDGDGTGNPFNDDPATDEDDADPARVKVYDLALRKTVKTPPPYSYYDDVVFEVEVHNQGNEEMKDIVVLDYVPEGFEFVPIQNVSVAPFAGGPNDQYVNYKICTETNGSISCYGTTNMLLVYDPGTRQITANISDLAYNQYFVYEVTLKPVQTNGGADNWTNYAEIASMKDSQDNPADTWDADSSPGTDDTHERAVKPGDPDDDNIDGHYIPDGTDEDDHDPAGIPVPDLALIKTTDVQPPYHYDQIVDFTLTIYNQGNKTAHDIEVVDYVPSGFIYLPHINPDWTQELVDTPKTVITTPLEPGESTTVTIKLQFQYTPEINGYLNKAEIVRALKDNGEPFDDIDSTPDDDPDNDIGGTPNTPEDDNVSDDGKDGDGDGITDEDDEDPWNVEVASIGNYVWYDNNDNGIQDDGLPSEVGVEGVTVILQDCNGQELLRTQTDQNGQYSFENLIPGEYLIVFEDLPENSIWAKDNIGNDALDSDAGEDGVTTCTELEAGEDDPTWDAGILKLSSLGDFVWLDEDADGIQDPEESAIPGVVVKLLDEDGNVLETTTTDEQGYYLFDSLRPGVYYVQFENPGGLGYSPLTQGNDPEKDSDANPSDDGKTSAITLGAGEDRRDIDAGFTCTLVVEVSPDITVCEGESVDLTVTVNGGQEPVSIIWTTGESTATITVTPAITTYYAVTVTDKYGCEDSGEVTVTVEPKAKIGDYVWLDLDRDGIQDFYIQDPDLDEPGINGVTVNLYKAGDPDNVFMTQLTHNHVDTAGYYEFEVCAGDYFVEFIPPTGQGYIFTQQDQGTDDSLDSDADPNTGRTIATHLDPAEVDHTWDAGFYTTASIGDFVWHDIDADGIQDDGEEGIDGVVVTLHRADGTVVGTTTTANGGKYEFNGLVPGDYYVCFDYSGTIYTQVSPANQGYDDTVDSDVDPESGCTEITEIVAGENDMTWDMGLYTLASLGDYVWYDKDADGCQDEDEEGIPEVTVRLYRDDDANGIPDGAELANTLTDDSGYYRFDNLAAGTYIVKFDKPQSSYKPSPKNHNGADGCDDASDSDGDAIFGYSDPVELSDNEHDPTIDMGYYETARLGDYVWYDKDGDGIQDPDEPGVSGVTVTLYKDTDGDGEPDTAVDTKVTNTGDEAGKYTFEDVEPGVYKICFDTDGDYDGFTIANSGSDDAVDSDADQEGGCTEVIVVESGDDDMTYDAGLVKYAELGDYVWEDEDADGYQDPGESPIEGVMVILLDGQGNEIDTTYTDADGLYKFDHLLPGEYIVHFEAPAGYKPTDKDAVASDTKDSDADPVSGNSHVVILEAGDSDMTIDAGYYKPASLGDYVWEDKDADGIQDPDENGINGIPVTLYDGDGNVLENTTTGVNPETGEDGYYEFDDLEPGTYYVCFDKGSWDEFTPSNSGSDDSKDSDANEEGGCTEVVVLESGEHDPTLDAGLYDYASLGDYVWLDLDADGIQDPIEPGINGIVVKLYKDDNADGQPDGAAIATTVTEMHNGKNGYYIFDNLVPGNYIVQFGDHDAYVRTTPDADNSDLEDSDADPLTGLSHTVNLESGEHDPSIDAGYYYAASLGDYVWYDEDGDGIQEDNEPCIDSVLIYLYKVSEVDGELDTVKVDSTWSHMLIEDGDTLGCGYYQFERLAPGDYIVQFVNPDTTQYHVSPKDQNYNDTKDSDIKEDGFTGIIHLDPGEHDPTVDAGFYRGECIEGVIWQDREEGYYEIDSLGRKIYTIPDVFDEFDIRLEGIVVELYSDPDIFDFTDDVLYMTTVTDSNGIYHFDNVEAGNYYLVMRLPDSLEVVNNDMGNDDMVDNDFYLSEETGLFRSQTFSLTANTDNECKNDVDGGTTRRSNTQPLNMLAFDATWDESEEVVRLDWSTVNEVNIAYYTLERKSLREEQFEYLMDVDANGKQGINRYGAKDPTVVKGNTYIYKLTVYGNDENIAGIYLAEVYIPAEGLNVSIYPNPFADRLFVVVTGNIEDKITLQVLDNLGRKVILTKVVENGGREYQKIALDFNNLPAGQYFVKFVSGNTVKLLKVVHTN